jgi:hypothetical protein
MRDTRTAIMIETKRKPPLWGAKAGARYVVHFFGIDARQRAIDYATASFGEYTIRERPTLKREQTRLDARADHGGANPSSAA